MSRVVPKIFAYGVALGAALVLSPGIAWAVAPTNPYPKTPHSREFCLALRPGVQAGQQIPATIGAGKTSGQFQDAKGKLLGLIGAVLKDDGAVQHELASAPSNVKAAFRKLVQSEGKFQSLVKRSTSMTQLRRAAQTLTNRQTLPFDFYVLSQCEGTTPVTPTAP